MNVEIRSKPSIGKLKIYASKEKADNIADFFLGGEKITLPEKAGFIIVNGDLINIGIWQRKGNPNYTRELYSFRDSSIVKLPRGANISTQTQKDIISFEIENWKNNSFNLEKYFKEEYSVLK